MKIICPHNWFAELVPHLQKYPFEGTIVLSESQRHLVDSHENLYLYQWDCYKWRENPLGWVNLLKVAKHIWCASQETLDNTHERYGIPREKMSVVKTFIPQAELVGECWFGGYVFQGARNSPEIRWDLLERACAELGLALVKATGQFSREEYLRLLRGASAVVSTRDEASTGGLCLFEGAMFNKPLLAYDTKSTREYFGDTIEYFDSYESLVEKLPNLKDRGAKSVVEKLTPERMAKEMYESTHRNP